MGVIGLPFQFWDVKSSYKIVTKMEYLNTIQAKIHVIQDHLQCIVWITIECSSEIGLQKNNDLGDPLG